MYALLSVSIKEHLSLDRPHSNPLGEILLEAKEHNNDRNRSQGSSCHNKSKVIGHLAQLAGNTKGNGLGLILGQHDQLQRILIPGIDKCKDCTWKLEVKDGTVQLDDRWIHIEERGEYQLMSQGEFAGLDWKGVSL